MTEKEKWLRAMKGHLVEERPDKLEKHDKQVTEFMDENTQSVGWTVYSFMGAIIIGFAVPFLGFILAGFGFYMLISLFTTDSDGDDNER